MRIFETTISLLEVPGEVSYTLGVSGCTRNCPGCSWAKNDTSGEIMSLNEFKNNLLKLSGTATVVTFLGGEWDEQFTDFLVAAKELGFKTCLYTGDNDPTKFGYMLDYLKVGEYIEALGGLASPTTNQKFINVATGENLNHLFIQ